MSVPSVYLDGLNSEQRRAVEHGVTQINCASGGPLLVIAGAGSGKTNTLAHRVAHLIVNGADPRRILLWGTVARRRLSNPLDDSFGQGPRVESGFRAQRGRRLPAAYPQT